MKNRHILSITVENVCGVLARIAGVFTARGYNIDSLTVAPTLDPDVSRITIVTFGDDKIIEAITKQINRLVNVLKIIDITGENCIDRELILIKVSAKDENRSEILRIVEIFNGRVIDASAKFYTVEVYGDDQKLGAIIELLRPLGVKDIVRTGKVAIERELVINSFGKVTVLSA